VSYLGATVSYLDAKASFLGATVSYLDAKASFLGAKEYHSHNNL
jgi:hypothetical protein